MNLTNHLGKIALVFVILVTGYTFYSTKLDIEKHAAANSTFVDDSGHLHVLGLILPGSTLREAEIKLKSRADTAIYIYPGEQGGRVTLEAFFPSIADHSKVILQLQASQAMLEAMQQHATPPRLYPDGVVRMNLGDEDVLKVLTLPITGLSLIPSLEIDQKMLAARFGKPAKEVDEGKGVIRQEYPDVYLTTILSPDGRARLDFTVPDKPATADVPISKASVTK
ncbi:MAG: hypothetical protein K9M17_05815 [Mariprofundaceae bacterium]|nr:hypothetical protein [Mariprofundaceae bacterium]